MHRNQDILNPSLMGDEPSMYALFRYLRDNDPVSYLEHPDYEPFWVLTRHADIRHVSHNNELFINNPRTMIMPRVAEEALLQQFGTRNGLETLIHMDNPKHRTLRGVTRDWFKPAPIEKLTPLIETMARDAVDKMAALGGECDFVKDVAMLFPLRVIMSILGVAPEEEGLMLRLTQELFGAHDPDQGRGGGSPEDLSVVIDLFDYFKQVVADRRAQPRDDLASVLANAEIDGKPMDELDQISYFIISATAGHDTTSATVSGGMKALIDFPSQRETLTRRPELARAAAREMVRWVSPVRHMMRTLTADAEFCGVPIKAGENISLWYPSANRDERAMNAPDDFDIERDNRNQLAFGWGGHMCLGQHLAVLEVEIFFRELLSRLDWIELAGDPQYVQAVFVGGLKSLPVRYAFK